MFLDVIQVLSTPDTDKAFFGIRQNKTRDVLISLQLIPKTVAVIINVFFHIANLRVLFTVVPSGFAVNQPAEVASQPVATKWLQNSQGRYG